jgi:hypothetical protein
MKFSLSGISISTTEVEMDSSDIIKYLVEFICDKGLYRVFVEWMEEKGYTEAEIEEATGED